MRLLHEYRNAALALLLFSMLALALIGLSVMRGDAGRLVLGPLQRMLKIVVRCKLAQLISSRIVAYVADLGFSPEQMPTTRFRKPLPSPRGKTKTK